MICITWLPAAPFTDPCNMATLLQLWHSPPPPPPPPPETYMIRPNVFPHSSPLEHYLFQQASPCHLAHWHHLSECLRLPCYCSRCLECLLHISIPIAKSSTISYNNSFTASNLAVCLHILICPLTYPSDSLYINTVHAVISCSVTTYRVMVSHSARMLKLNLKH